ELTHAEIGSGWFKDRFVYLFGEGLDELAPCLKAWSFLIGKSAGDRMILGHNAHGAILILEDANGHDQTVRVLDPVRVQYQLHSNLNLANLIGHALPKGEIGGFLDDDLYAEWVRAKKDYLPDGFILAPRTPKGLGGERHLDNFQVEEMVSYYKTTG